MRVLRLLPGKDIDPIEVIEVPGTHATLTDLYEAIGGGCSMIQQVRVCGVGLEPHLTLPDPVMLVDEEAGFKPLEINYPASWLFGYAWHKNMIRGKVLLVWTEHLAWGGVPEHITPIYVQAMIEQRRHRHGE